MCCCDLKQLLVAKTVVPREPDDRQSTKHFRQRPIHLYIRHVQPGAKKHSADRVRFRSDAVEITDRLFGCSFSMENMVDKTWDALE